MKKASIQQTTTHSQAKSYV